jgi:hypothetical protein
LSHEDDDLRSNQFGRQPCRLIECDPFHPPGVDGEVLALDIPELADPLTKSVEEGCCGTKG